jgi:hypothetical protein
MVLGERGQDDKEEVEHSGHHASSGGHPAPGHSRSRGRLGAGDVPRCNLAVHLRRIDDRNDAAGQAAEQRRQDRPDQMVGYLWAASRRCRNRERCSGRRRWSVRRSRCRTLQDGSASHARGSVVIVGLTAAAAIHERSPWYPAPARYMPADAGRQAPSSLTRLPRALCVPSLQAQSRWPGQPRPALLRSTRCARESAAACAAGAGGCCGCSTC